MRSFLAILLLYAFQNILNAQSIELFQQFNGRYDYTAIGNTLNVFENNLDGSFCEILPESSAVLNTSTDQAIAAAYLYWAGSGEADTEVTVNGFPVTSDLNYSVSFDSSSGNLIYFSCFSDITALVLQEGNTVYTLSDLDISQALSTNPGYCNTRTNFAGWSIYVIYEDQNLPLNQVSLFQGLEIINTNVTEKTIVLENINVLDNIGAKIGFLAWEGDDALNFGETLSINDNILSNPPLNLSDNAFNGTNTFTNSSEFYNADLDVYNIQNNIEIGDTSATIKLTTGDFDSTGAFRADLIILNNIITVLNSQLPDATVQIDGVSTDCNQAFIEVEYTVFNINSTDVLPADTALAFYLDGEFVAVSSTANDIPIGGSEQGSIFLDLNGGDEILSLVLVVDDDGTGTGTINETNEDNNIATTSVDLLASAPVIDLPDLLSCDQGLNSAVFDLEEILQEVPSGLDIEAGEFYLT
ncbi:MAG: gliding motility-associated C-terminal domain-containing protein, partial [Bacteroidia bacterium]|nr:gliding motility-associated C-terminal domain-containing protein [Bacteroidia bacterium]